MNSINPESIDIESFNYDLPEHKIAQKPENDRSASKLLVYQQGKISDSKFHELNHYLPKKSLLIFNNTRVIPARLFFKRDSGAVIQIFLLSPKEPYVNSEQALENKTGNAIWECMVGNAKKWKKGEGLTLSIVINESEISLEARLMRNDTFQVSFNWREGISFSDIIESIGKMPLPPYIKRQADLQDSEKYQTVFAKNKGAVAAPTAGLHFTDDLIESLKNHKHDIAELTLHVGAGTFKPVETNLVWNHPMHEEAFLVDLKTIEKLLNAPTRIATGTTSLRTLESLYWIAQNLHEEKEHPFVVSQHQPYEVSSFNLTYQEALEVLHKHTLKNNLLSIYGESSLMILPGYKIRSVNGLITNFHLPKSTLLLLISAFIGDDWHQVYKHALENDYRFLSYGDSSILLR